MIELNKIADIKASMDIIQKAQSAIENDESSYVLDKLKEDLTKHTNEYIIELLRSMRDECSRLILLYEYKKPKKQKK